MKITVLAGNSVCKTNPLNAVSEHGLSLFIEFDARKILFDTGQSDLFVHTAREMGIDLSQLDYMVVSHGGFDNRGGLKRFLRINQKARIFLHINASHNFYSGLSGFIPCHMELDQVIPGQNSRIYFIEEDTQIEDKLILLEGFQDVIPQPEEQRGFFERTKHRFSVDKSGHELAMLLIENDEIVLFSGCSYSGIINTIDEVKLFSKTMKIKAAFSSININNTAEKPPPVIHKVFLGKMIKTVNTGEVFEI